MLGVTLLVSACSYQPGIHNAVASGDGRTLDLSMNNCHGDYSVSIIETSDRVSIEVTDNRTPISLSGDDCADSVHMNLDEPLGSRTLVNDLDGSEINVTYRPWNQGKYSEAEYIAAIEAAAACVEKAEPDASATISTHPDGYPILSVDWPDLGDGQSRSEAGAFACIEEHIEPLQR